MSVDRTIGSVTKSKPGVEAEVAVGGKGVGSRMARREARLCHDDENGETAKIH